MAKCMGDQEFSRLWTGAVVVLARPVKVWVYERVRNGVALEVVPAGTEVEVLRPSNERANADKRVKAALGPRWVTVGRVAGSGGAHEMTLRPEDVVAGSARRGTAIAEPGNGGSAQHGSAQHGGTESRRKGGGA